MRRPGDEAASGNRIRDFLARNGLFFAAGLLAAAGLKSHYSGAGPDDLGWILDPTTRCVELLTGIRFARELHAGFIDHAHRIVIGPACAGVNFTIIAFCTFFFAFVHRCEGHGRKLAWFVFCGAASWLLAVGANTLRIVAAIHLYGADIYGGWLTPARVHRIAGTVVYFSFLLASYPVVERIARRVASAGPREGRDAAPSYRRRVPGVPTGFVPFFWYVLVALGIPLLGVGGRPDRARLPEHYLPVLSVCLGLVLVSLVPAGCRRLAAHFRKVRRGRAREGG